MLQLGTILYAPLLGAALGFSTLLLPQAPRPFYAWPETGVLTGGQTTGASRFLITRNTFRRG